MAQVVAKKNWGAVHVWMTLAGADLAHRDKTEAIVSPVFRKFGNALELFEDLRNRGATCGVCPPCAEYAGAVGDHKHDWVEKAGGDWLMENIQDAWVLWM
jgi:predicted peroxiredoxin